MTYCSSGVSRVCGFAPYKAGATREPHSLTRFAGSAESTTANPLTQQDQLFTGTQDSPVRGFAGEPKQSPSKTTTPANRKSAGFERANTIAATIILEDPDRWGGDESLMVRWARMFTEGRTK